MEQNSKTNGITVKLPPYRMDTMRNLLTPDECNEYESMQIDDQIVVVHLVTGGETFTAAKQALQRLNVD